MWVTCKLLVFRDNQGLYPVFQCDVCPGMSDLHSLRIDQDRDNLHTLKCLHSRMAELATQRRGNWDQVWPMNLADIQPADEVFEIRCNENQDHVTLREDAYFLAAYYHQNTRKISVLSTITSKEKTPRCYSCTKKPCKCLGQYKIAVKAQHHRDNPLADPDEFRFYWDKRKSTAKHRDAPTHQFEDPVTFNKYGYNRRKIEYPIREDFKNDNF